MRIGHFCNRIWAPGGIATYVRRVSDYQRSHGDEVVFLTGRDDTELADANGRTAQVVATDAELLTRASGLKLDVLHTYTEVNVELARSTVPVVRTVMVHGPYCPSSTRFLRSRNEACNRRFTLTGCTWGHLIDRCGSARPHQLLIDLKRPGQERRSLAGVRIIAISEFVKSQLIREGYDPSKIDMIYLPIRQVVPVDRPVENTNRGDRPRVLYAGRLTPEKGVAWLLRAFAQTKTGAVLDIAGLGNEADSLRALAVKLGVADRVSFLGWVNEAGVDRLMSAAVAAVFPSVWHEPFGLVAVEAMARGVPVIGSSVGAIPETVKDGHNGLLVPPNDELALAIAIDRLVADPVLAARLGNAGRIAAAGRFGLANHMRQLATVYAKAIAAKGQPTPARSK